MKRTQDWYVISSMKPAIFAMLVVLACPLHGCGKAKVPGLVSAQGSVVYEGVPLPWAIISLTPEKQSEGARPATAQTDGEGKFSLKTLGEHGALPGTYKVSISKYILKEGHDTLENWRKARKSADFKEPAPKENVFNVISAIPEKYTNAKKSGLTLTVDSGGSRELVIKFGND